MDAFARLKETLGEDCSVRHLERDIQRDIQRDIGRDTQRKTFRRTLRNTVRHSKKHSMRLSRRRSEFELKPASECLSLIKLILKRVIKVN